MATLLVSASKGLVDGSSSTTTTSTRHRLSFRRAGRRAGPPPENAPRNAKVVNKEDYSPKLLLWTEIGKWELPVSKMQHIRSHTNSRGIVRRGMAATR